MSPEQSAAFKAIAKFVKQNDGDLFDIRLEGNTYSWGEDGGIAARISWEERAAVRRGQVEA